MLRLKQNCLKIKVIVIVIIKVNLNLMTFIKNWINEIQGQVY